MRNDLTALFWGSPHIHGEYIVAVSYRDDTPGSPPHTWGILYKAPRPAFLLGITPTYMGNTLWRFSRLSVETGSPPHTWGIREVTIGRMKQPRITPTYMGNTPFSHLLGLIYLRITPTYMGNTISSRVLSGWSRDHPHIHGEYVFDDKNIYSKVGSPPHTWGIQTWLTLCKATIRITPTYMGNTS